MSRAAAAVALLVALGGCNKARLVEESAHAGISPLSLAFGPTPVLFPVEKPLQISNAGGVPLHVSGAHIEGGQAAAFQVDSSPLTVPGRGAQTLTVVFVPPTTGDFAATLLLATDDADNPSFTVPLTGSGTITAAISVRPAMLEFGRVGEGQAAVREVIVSSVGQADLYLSSLGFAPGTPAGYSLLDARATAVVAAGSSLTLAVLYSPPQGAAEGGGALRIGSSDPLQQLVDVPLMATIDRAPVAVALGSVNGGLPRTEIDTAAGAQVKLDGSASSDPDGDLPLTYQWTLATAPLGSTATIADETAAVTAITLDVAGSYSFLLTVTDAQGVPSIMPARLDVRALPPDELLVELVWDKVPPDLDLHFLKDGAERDTSDDCSWTNPDPSTFGTGTDGNPHYLGDALTGYGPEQVVWKLPTSGDYRIDVVYKAAHGATDPATNASVRIYAFGEQIAELTHAFAQQGDTWTAGVVSWPTATVVASP